MSLLNLRINFYLLQTFFPHLGSFLFFLCCFFFHYVSAKFHHWPSSGDLPQPRIGMLSLVTVSPVITAFHSCCLSHHIFDQVNLLGRIWNRYLLTMLTWNRRDSTPLSAAPRAPKGDQGWIFWSYKSLSGLPESGPYRIFCTGLLIGIILRWVFLIWELIFIYCRLFFFLCCFFFHHVSAKFHHWPSSGDLPRPRIGMLSLVTVFPVITAFHSCCLSHHIFDRVNLWPAWVGFETAIFWQCSPGTVETQHLYPLRHWHPPPKKNKKNYQDEENNVAYKIFT